MLDVSNLCFSYGRQQILSHVSFSLAAGEVGALVGFNGAGKSTLLRCIAGWAQPDSGQISVQNLSLQEERVYRRYVRFVPDSPDFFDELTAWEHLRFTAELSRMKEWRAKAEALLSTQKLFDVRDRYPFTFSRGMKVKLAICMALITTPALLILDEPFGPLDPISAENLSELLLAAQKEGHSILFSTHTIPEFIQPTHYLLLEDGRVTTHSSVKGCSCC